MHIQMRRRHRRDKKLAAVGAGPGIGHRQQTFAVKFNGWRKFILKRPAPKTLPSASGPGRVPALKHESFNNPMKNNAVIITLLDQADKILDGLGRDIGE